MGFPVVDGSDKTISWQPFAAGAAYYPTTVLFKVTAIAGIIEMVYVQGGTFTMSCTSEQGSDCRNNEKPAHRVTVSDFSIGKYEVTQAQWCEVMGSDPPYLIFTRCDNFPVEEVCWNEVQAFFNSNDDRF